MTKWSIRKVTYIDTGIESATGYTSTNYWAGDRPPARTEWGTTERLRHKHTASMCYFPSSEKETPEDKAQTREVSFHFLIPAAHLGRVAVKIPWQVAGCLSPHFPLPSLLPGLSNSRHTQTPLVRTTLCGRPTGEDFTHAAPQPSS